jgi:tetratricopeptide (TPR) repeat protein
MSRRARAGLAIFILALITRLAYVHQSDEVLGLDVSLLTQTDNHVFVEWARIIAAGDILCREQPHAYHEWTREVAPESRWLEWYGGATTFHQTPLYPYFVAAVFKLLGDDRLMLGYAQALLGALTCLLTFLLASRMISLRAGVIAGLLLAFMSNYYFYDAFILRDGPMAFVVVLTTLALDVAVERGRARDWLLAGASLGLFTLAKETGLPLLLLTLGCLVIVWHRRPGRLLRTAAQLLAGWMAVVSPAYVRNVMVDASTFRLSTRGPEVFITGNAKDQSGVSWNPPIELMRELLMESNFSLPRAMALTLATHRSDPLGYLGLLWNKTSAYLNSYEVPNNVNYYLYRAHLPTLRLGFVSMAFVAPAMLLGLVLGITRRKRLGVLYVMLGAISASVILLYILGRFRVQALPLMAIFAALSVDWAWTVWSRRQWATLVLAAFPLSLLGWWTWSDADPFRDDNKNASIMMQLAKVGNFERAMHFRDQLLAGLEQQRGEAFNSELNSKLNIIQGSFQSFDQAMASPSGTAPRHHALAEGYAALVPITKRGDMREFATLSERHFRRALDLDDGLVGVRHGLGSLLASLENHYTHQGPQRFGDAYGWFMEELDVHPDHGPSHRDAARFHLLWEQWVIALQHFMAAEVYGTYSGETLAAIGRISADSLMADQPPMRVAGEAVPCYDPVRAMGYARRAIALAPDDPNVLTFVSDTYYILGQYDESLELMERLKILQPWKSAELQARIEAFESVKARRLAPGTEAVEAGSSDDEGAAVPVAAPHAGEPQEIEEISAPEPDKPC